MGKSFHKEKPTLQDGHEIVFSVQAMLHFGYLLLKQYQLQKKCLLISLVEVHPKHRKCYKVVYVTNHTK